MKKMFEPILKKKDGIIECMPPESLREGCREGLYRIYGGVVRTKTGQIAGYLQQTTSSGELDVAQTFSTIFEVAGIASSVLNLGVSVMTLSKVSRMSRQLESIERRLESMAASIDQRLESIELILGSIDKKIDLLARDALLKSLKELKDIERTHAHVFFELEGASREMEAATLRRELGRISSVFEDDLSKSLESEYLNAELCRSLIEVLGLSRQMYASTLFATSQFKAIERFGHLEVERTRNLVNVLNSKNVPQTSTDLHPDGAVALAKEMRLELTIPPIVECCENSVRNLESLTSLADTLRRRDVSGEEYCENLARSEEMGPVVFFSAEAAKDSR